MTNVEAPAGQVFVCSACGKRSKDRYGYRAIDAGWDESCMLNAVLCYVTKKFTDAGVLTWHAVKSVDR
jgi:transposase-like protein